MAPPDFLREQSAGEGSDAGDGFPAGVVRVCDYRNSERN
jgi:hypothetical protein